MPKEFNLVLKSTLGVGTVNTNRTFQIDGGLLHSYKKYRLNFTFMSRKTNAPSMTLCYLSLDFGAFNVYEPLGIGFQMPISRTIGVLKPLTITPPSYVITDTEITTNLITLKSTVGLAANRAVQISGTAFGGLNPGIYNIATINTTTNEITLTGVGGLTTLSGLMTLQDLQADTMVFNADYNTNPPVYITDLPNVSTITVRTLNDSNNTWSDGNSSMPPWVLILNFVEVD